MPKGLPEGGVALGELAQLAGGEVRGDPSLVIRGVAGLAEAGPSDIAFFTNPRYRAQYEATRAGAVIVDAAAAEEKGAPPCAKLVARHPYVAFAKISAYFHPPARHPPGVHERAVVEEGAQVDPAARVMPLAYVGRGAIVGPRAVLHPGAVIEAGASIGADTVVHANAVVRERCVVGARCILHPGVVIGADGFGFAFDMEAEEGPVHRKVPQIGIVRVEDDVEIGANTCIDRATLGETVIGRGTKIDDLVMIAHNVRVGPLCILVSQAGVAGSTELGAGVTLAGQAGVVGHLKVGDMARVGAQSGVISDVEPGATVAGSPALPHREWLRVVAAQRQVPDLLREVRELRRRLEALEKR